VSDIEQVENEIAALERRHPDQEWRPWACADHPLALQHWRLTQYRIELKRVPKRAGMTPEQRAQAGERLRKARMSSRLAA
jgi:hypothetical protein